MSGFLSYSIYGFFGAVVVGLIIAFAVRYYFYLVTPRSALVDTTYTQLPTREQPAGEEDIEMVKRKKGSSHGAGGSNADHDLSEDEDGDWDEWMESPARSAPKPSAGGRSSSSHAGKPSHREHGHLSGGSDSDEDIDIKPLQKFSTSAPSRSREEPPRVKPVEKPKAKEAPRDKGKGSRGQASAQATAAEARRQEELRLERDRAERAQLERELEEARRQLAEARSDTSSTRARTEEATRAGVGGSPSRAPASSLPHGVSRPKSKNYDLRSTDDEEEGGRKQGLAQAGHGRSHHEEDYTVRAPLPQYSDNETLDTLLQSSSSLPPNPRKGGGGSDHEKKGKATASKPIRAPPRREEEVDDVFAVRCPAQFPASYFSPLRCPPSILSISS